MDNFPSSWLRVMWSDSRDTGREVIWRAFPECVLDRLESSSDLVISSDDVDFLIDVIEDSLTNERQVAIRLLGLLVEENRIPPDRVIPLFSSLLDHPSPATRHQAVEAFWQISDRSHRDTLVKAQSKETNPAILKTLDHVIRIFS